MSVHSRFNENRVLAFSAVFASMFAGGGLIVGLLVGSLVIMFDGVYSLVSLLLTLLSLVAARYIKKPSDAQFPFGRAIFEPAVIAVKGAVILLIVSYSLYSAIGAMFTGGRAVDVSIATAFGVINVIGCGLVWWCMVSLRNKHFSGLIDAEVKQWQMDTLLSVAVTAGFVVAWLMTLTPLAKYAVYADPMMMLLMSFYFIKVPFEMLRSALREIFLMAPSKEIYQTVDQSIMVTNKDSQQEIELAGVVKVGHELWVDVDLHVDDSSELISCDDIEQARHGIETRLSSLPLKLQLTINIAS